MDLSEKQGSFILQKGDFRRLYHLPHHKSTPAFEIQSAARADRTDASSMLARSLEKILNLRSNYLSQ